MPTIAHLPELVAALPAALRDRCNQLFLVERVQGQAIPPPPMHPWVEQHFGSVEAVTTQTIIKVTNRLTLETAVYNPLRARRPLDSGRNSASSADAALEAAIAAYAGEQDTFRNPEQGTTADTFGRIRGAHCVSASNIAKYDGWHGLVIFNPFHPLTFTRAQLRDYFDVALRWLVAAHQTDPRARYPLITWNCLWKSGASITHGHLQMVLSQQAPFGKVEQQRRSRTEYQQRTGRDLSDDLYLLHEALGLAVTHSSDVRGYVTLTPIKDRELTLESATIPALAQLQATGTPPVHGPPLDAAALSAALVPLWDATYTALRHLIEQQGVRSFNLVAELPPLAPVTEAWGDARARVRVVDRGDPLSRMVNFGAMELYAGSIINTDPFALAAVLRPYFRVSRAP